MSKCKPSEDVCLEHCLPLKGMKYCEDGRDRCSHDFGERRETCFAEIQGERRAFVVRACLECGIWLPLGPSDEEPVRVRVEVRAAELVDAYEPTLADVAGPNASDEECIGWACHRDDGPGDVPRTDAAWSGWFAREVYDAIHEIDDDIEAEDEMFGNEHSHPESDR